MSLRTPSASSVSPSPNLLPFLRGEWANYSHQPLYIGKKELAEKINKFDSWFKDLWPKAVEKFASDIGSKELNRNVWLAAIKDIPDIPAHDKMQQFVESEKIIVTANLARKAAENFLHEYLNPLVPRAGESNLLINFLNTLVTTKWFSTGLEIMLNDTHPLVKILESEHDSQIRANERWNGSPPESLNAILTSSSDVTYIPRLTSKKSKQRNRENERLRQVNRQTQKMNLLSIPLNGGRVAPANLFISVISPTVLKYLNILEIVLYRDRSDEVIKEQMVSVSFGLIARVLIPFARLWDYLDGTSIATVFLPSQLEMRKVIIEFITSRFTEKAFMEVLARPMAKHEAKLLDAFRELWQLVMHEEKIAYRAFISFIETQSKGRVLLPKTFTEGAGWKISVRKVMGEDASEQEKRERLEVTIPERLFYTNEGPQPDDKSIFWLISSAWRQVLTAVALMNQSGVACWITAGNNRWSGRHLPHVTHRYGVSLDIDSGFDPTPIAANGKEAPPPAAIQNVQQRDSAGEPTKNRGNLSLSTCLKKTDRLAGWITVQAFIIAGIRQFLFGDDGIVYEATLHVNETYRTSALPISMKEDPAVQKKERFNAPANVYDPHGHYNHFHFEIARPPFGEEHFYSGAEGYLWMLPVDDLFTSLYKQALIRDSDPKFWLYMAGLSSVPRSKDDFVSLRKDARDKGMIPKNTTDDDIAGWQAWWGRGRDSEGQIASFDVYPGLPLLPIWNPNVAERIRPFDSCLEIKVDFAFG